MTRDEKRAFYGGYACALSAAVNMAESGTHTSYLQAMRELGPAGRREFLNWAKRNQDIELPRIRQAMRFLKEKP